MTSGTAADTKSAAPASGAGAAPPRIVDLIDEDDEFEEFALTEESTSNSNNKTQSNNSKTQATTNAQSIADSKQWTNSWDDDDVDDDFINQLRKELKSKGGKSNRVDRSTAFTAPHRQ